MRDFLRQRDSQNGSSSSSSEATAADGTVENAKASGKVALATFVSGLVLGILVAISLGSLMGRSGQAQPGEASATIASTPASTPSKYTEAPPVDYFVVDPDTTPEKIAQAANEHASDGAIRYFVFVPKGAGAEEVESRLADLETQYMEGGWPFQVIDLR